eukprot:XP_025012000.1 uncharacterized protein LOC107260776 [Ricinus communis]
MVPIFLCFFILISATSTTTATDHIVGANKGWNPGINYTLWANNHTFYVGDFICIPHSLFSVLVHPLPPPPSSSISANQTSSKDSAAPVVLHKGFVGCRALILAFTSIWFGFGWI